MQRDYYRSVKGFEGRRYRVRVPEAELKGLVTTLVISGLMLAAVTGILSFFWGLSVR